MSGIIVNSQEPKYHIRKTYFSSVNMNYLFWCVISFNQFGQSDIGATKTPSWSVAFSFLCSGKTKFEGKRDTNRNKTKGRIIH